MRQEKHPSKLSGKEIIDLALNDKTSNVPLIAAINNLNKTSTILSVIMIVLTFAIFLLTVVMVVRV